MEDKEGGKGKREEGKKKRKGEEKVGRKGTQEREEGGPTNNRVATTEQKEKSRTVRRDMS